MKEQTSSKCIHCHVSEGTITDSNELVDESTGESRSMARIERKFSGNQMTFSTALNKDGNGPHDYT